MATLVYAPGVEVLIETDQAGILDVSKDIQRGTVTLRENSPHSMLLTILNHRRQYDGLFTPNDRFTVKLKRLRWLLVMSGYLNVVPFFSVHPRSVTLSGTCTLKRLQYWLFDPGSQAWNQLIQTTPQQMQQLDQGIAEKVTDILVQVADWPKENIHLGGIPPDFLKDVITVQNGTSTVIDWNGVGLKSTITINGEPGGGSSDSSDVALFLHAIRDHESGGDYTANSGDGAYGAYQYIPSTWVNMAHAAGIANPPPTANLATPQMQDQVATFDATQKFNTYHDWGKCAIAWYTGDGNFPPSEVPSPGAGNTMTAGAYADWIVNRMNQLRGSGATPTNGSNNGGFTQTDPTTGAGATSTAQPRPNNNDILTFARTQLGKPYTQVNRFGPDGYDCSGYVCACYNQAGANMGQLVSDDIGHGSQQIPMQQAYSTPGAIIGQWGSGNDGHVAMTLGTGGPDIIQSGGGDGVNISTVQNSFDSSNMFYGLWPGVHYGNVTGAGAGGAGSSPINVFYPQTAGLVQSEMYGGLRALMNDVPLLSQGIEPLIAASLRSYASAPNGDFIAWFPDWFNLYGIAGTMVINDIELQDFSMTWSDLEMITHQFVTGAQLPDFFSPVPQGSTIPAVEALTSGIASVDIPEIMEAIFQWSKQPESRLKDLLSDKGKIYQRFGARMDYHRQLGLNGANTEITFWAAARLFMYNWAKMFNAYVPITWMPEVFPGMILQFPNYGAQMYVQQVNHTFDFEAGTFDTGVNVLGPTKIGGSGIGSITGLTEPIGTVAA